MKGYDGGMIVAASSGFSRMIVGHQGVARSIRISTRASFDVPDLFHLPSRGPIACSIAKNHGDVIKRLAHLYSRV